MTNFITNIFRLATNAFEPGARADGGIRATVQRPLGQGRGIVAGAHKLARIIWALIVNGQPCDETKAFWTTPARTARRLKNLQNQAQALNMKLIPA